jgi:hypothetical protein
MKTLFPLFLGREIFVFTSTLSNPSLVATTFFSSVNSEFIDLIKVSKGKPSILKSEPNNIEFLTNGFAFNFFIIS